MAKRDAPEVAKDCWTFPCPAGPNGRSIPFIYVSTGFWKFAKNKTAAKELVQYLMEREQVEERAIASEGFNLPPQLSMSDFKIWEDVEPPKGTVYNYPIRPWHNAKRASPAIRRPGHRGADVQPRDHSVDVAEAALRPVDQAGDRLGEG